MFTGWLTVLAVWPIVLVLCVLAAIAGIVWFAGGAIAVGSSAVCDWALNVLFGADRLCRTWPTYRRVGGPPWEHAGAGSTKPAATMKRLKP